MTTPQIVADATNLYIFYPNYRRFQLDRQMPGAADAFVQRLKQHGAKYSLDDQMCGFGFSIPRNDQFRENFHQLVQTGLLDDIAFGLGRQLEAGDLSSVKWGVITFKSPPRLGITDPPVTIVTTDTT
jgi:hypothetical protein